MEEINVLSCNNLYAICVKMKWQAPRYIINQDPASSLFSSTVIVIVDEAEMQEVGEGKSIKQSKNAAAQRMLQKIQSLLSSPIIKNILEFKDNIVDLLKLCNKCGFQAPLYFYRSLGNGVHGYQCIVRTRRRKGQTFTRWGKALVQSEAKQESAALVLSEIKDYLRIDLLTKSKWVRHA